MKRLKTKFGLTELVIVPVNSFEERSGVISQITLKYDQNPMVIFYTVVIRTTGQELVFEEKDIFKVRNTKNGIIKVK